MFGRESKHSVDIFLGNAVESDAPENWVQAQENRSREAHRIAKLQIEQKADERKARHDKMATEHRVAVGDRVYLRKRVPGRSKIEDTWHSKVFTLVERRQDTVYVVCPANGFSEERTVSRREVRQCTQPWSAGPVSSHSPHIDTHRRVRTAPRERHQRKASTSSDSSSNAWLAHRHESSSLEPSHVHVNNPPQVSAHQPKTSLG